MPTGRRGRLWALILVLIALGGVYLLVVTPLLDLYAERQAVLESRRMLLPRLKAAADELPGLRARASELRAAASTRKVTLEGASDAIASANLQSRIEELAASVGAAIGSTESLPAEVRAGYRRIGLRYVLSGPYETLVKLLARTRVGNAAARHRQSAYSRRTEAAGHASGFGARCRARRLRFPQQ